MTDRASELTRCKPWLLAALERGDGAHAWEDVEAAVLAGTRQLWPAPDAAMVTEILSTKRKRWCHVFLAGGDLARIVEMVPSVEAWARAQRCQAVTICGRKGWERVLAPHGVKPAHLTLSKEL